MITRSCSSKWFKVILFFHGFIIKSMEVYDVIVESLRKMKFYRCDTIYLMRTKYNNLYISMIFPKFVYALLSLRHGVVRITLNHTVFLVTSIFTLKCNIFPKIERRLVSIQTHINITIPYIAMQYC